MEQLITTYGPYIALLVVGSKWIWDFLTNRVYTDTLLRREAYRIERRDERSQLVSLVENNTKAMTLVASAVDRLSRDVGHLYTHLDIERPGEERK